MAQLKKKEADLWAVMLVIKMDVLSCVSCPTITGVLHKHDPV